jgi:hypothetical protein
MGVCNNVMNTLIKLPHSVGTCIHNHILYGAVGIDILAGITIWRKNLILADFNLAVAKPYMLNCMMYMYEGIYRTKAHVYYTLLVWSASPPLQVII